MPHVLTEELHPEDSLQCHDGQISNTHNLRLHILTQLTVLITVKFSE